MMPYEMIYTLNGSERASLSEYELGVYDCKNGNAKLIINNCLH